MNNQRLFDQVCAYAELTYPRRAEPSRAADLTQRFFTNPYGDNCTRHMVLYETDKRIVEGHKEPEVHWVVINEYGRVIRMAARNIRKMNQVCGFGFQQGVKEQIWTILKDKTKEDTQ